MALTGKKYEKFYATTGSGDDKVKSATLTQAEALWDGDRVNGCKDLLEDFTLGPIVFQLQQMQDEIDYLRSEISSNKDKKSMSLGTSGTTALAGDTKLIDIGLHTTLSFGDLTETINKGKATYTILLSATRDFGGKTGVLTKSSIITLM